jgi:hypothetical protein
MKRFCKEDIERSAREFAASDSRHSWHLFGPVIRNALIDAYLMQEIRWMYSADSERALTPAEIIEFRDAMVARLAEGVVPAGKRNFKIALKIED